MLKRSEVEPLLDLNEAIEVTKAVVLEEIAGSVIRMPPFGGQGWSRRILRIVGGGMFGVGRFGLRAGPLAMLYDADSWEALAIMDLPTGDLRLSASVGLAARYLARPDAERVALVGSGGVAFGALRGLCSVRNVKDVRVWSRTFEHCVAFAERASTAFGVPVTPVERPAEMLGQADIVAVATNARVPLVWYEQLRPGTHVSSSGLIMELDESVYRHADQIVTTSRQQEIVSLKPSDTPGIVPGGPLWDLLTEGALTEESIVELGDVVSGKVPPRVGPTDINVYLESRGGLGDAALASRAYDIARERGLGTEFDLR
jgi:ornithine cyclodeaminase/alanine dehydrogenase-like protein (mu-crystallin family)